MMDIKENRHFHLQEFCALRKVVFRLDISDIKGVLNSDTKLAIFVESGLVGYAVSFRVEKISRLSDTIQSWKK